MLNRTMIVALTGLSFAFTGCGGSGVDGTPAPLDEFAQKGQNGKTDEWGPSDDPRLFSDTLEYSLDRLPKEGEAANIPWAGSYWPVYEDAINHRWDGDNPSPAAKYGEAFGISDIEDKVSAAHGIENAGTHRQSCKETSDCTASDPGKCVKRRGAGEDEEGVCVPTWWGICHAWAPAAILEPEALHPVTKNGVEFKVNDIKALVTLVYNRSASKFVSLRCNKQKDEINYDLYDRPTSDDAECRDTNPGTYHVLLANYLGLMGQAFAEDRTFDWQVWNQPIRSYKVNEMTEVTAKEANMKVGVEEGPSAAQRRKFNGELEEGEWKHDGPYEVEAGKKLEVVIETSTWSNKKAHLYVRFGSTPNETDFDCGPNEDGNNETCSLDVPEGEDEVYVSVFAKTGKPTFTVESDLDKGNIVAVPEAYMFNDNAAKFFYVKSEVQYITESPSSLDGNLADRIDNYTKTDRYEYILELDEDGDIIGGEWVGWSKKNHPDFLWLPTGRYNQPIAGGAIKFQEVKDLLEASLIDPSDQPGSNTGDMIVATEQGTVGQDSWTHFGPYAAGNGSFLAEMSGDGDADLYVRKGAQPTKDAYDCRPFTAGSSDTCDVEGPGEFYVSVWGFQTSNFTLKLTYSKPGANDTPSTDGFVHLSETGSVAEGGMAYYELPVVAGRKIVIRTECDSDIDLYARMNLIPTEALYDFRSYRYTGNELLEIMPEADGTLNIGVHGYAAGDFTITSADE
jgi:hypothetical protein